jgi:hypothetical protein
LLVLPGGGGRRPARKSRPQEPPIMSLFPDE